MFLNITFRAEKISRTVHCFLGATRKPSYQWTASRVALLAPNANQHHVLPSRRDERGRSLSLCAGNKRNYKQSKLGDEVSQDKILSEIERFRKVAATKVPASREYAAPGASFEWLRTWTTNLLTINAFLVFLFMGWLLLGVALKITTGHSALLDIWYTLWQPFVQPLIGLLMIGALASKFLRR
ncbi:hypothetical protein CCYA_CCYA15G3938 [Cyanidiococcus yangmingshanensis]|nr:hypothetical protein CCYA_CCYA15G3938 [Cyanidiococcus yangmingshanensis]